MNCRGKWSLLCLLFAGSPNYAATVSETLEFTVSDMASLRLNHVSGDVVVEPGDTDKVVVYYTSADGRNLTVNAEQVGQHITIDVIQPSFGLTNFLSGGRFRKQVSFRIQFPVNGRLDLRSQDGDVEVRGISGGTKLYSISGNVRVRDATGRFELETVSGNLQLDGIREADVSGSSVSGDIYVSNTELTGIGYEFSTTSGKIDLSHSAQASFFLDAQSMGGKVTVVDRENLSSLTPPLNNRGSILRGSYNSGGITVTLFSVSGNIGLKLD